MRPFALLAPVLLAVCVGCGGGGSSSVPAGPAPLMAPIITAQITNPAMENFVFGQPVLLQWTLGGGAPTKVTIESYDQQTINVDPKETSVTVVPTTPCGYYLKVENAAGFDDGYFSFNVLPSQTTLVSSANPSALAQSITFTASATPGATGTMEFWDWFGGQNVLIGSNPVGSGLAVFSTSALATGNHSIKAWYRGDTFYNGSLSPVLNQVVTP